MTSTRRLLVRRLLTVSAAGALLSLPVAPTLAASDHGNSNGKVTICHATHSDTNPYVVHTPNKNGHVSGHSTHVGPIWAPGLKADHVAWGDIIPPFDYLSHGTTKHFPGLNWTSDGQAWFANACRPPVTAAVDKTNDADGDATYSDSETATNPGSAVSFQVVVTNTSIVPAVVTAVSDAVGADAVTFTASPDPVGTVLAPGASTTFTFTVEDYSPVDGDAKTNTVTVTLASTTDAANTGSAHDDSTVMTSVPPPPAPDVAVTKTGTPTASPGDELTWTLTATNTGSVPAADVTMSDTLPDGTTLVSATGDGWTVEGTTTLTMTYDTELGVGASASVTVVATLDAAFAGTTVDNTVVVTPEDETPADNTATWTTDVVSGGGGGGGGGFTGGGGGTITGGGGGTLPRTGDATWLLLAIGLALVLSGSGFVLLPQAFPPKR
jgi:uncharacterized repeat protein (TIGR01451 family)/LPXTG-motif cell wall-anchored protein